MSDVFETKKITELSESKSAADSDLLMVGNPSTGELSKITKENYLSEITEDLSKKADQTEVDEITEDLSKKADQTEVDEITEDLSKKADQTAVDKNADAITQINEDLSELDDSATYSTVGGRNLILSTETETEIHNSFVLFYLSDYGLTEDMIRNREITISFWAKSDIEDTKVDAYMRAEGVNTNGWTQTREIPASYAQTVGTDWEYHVFHCTNNDNNNSKTCSVRCNTTISGQTVNDEATLKIKFVKCELGNHATDWTAAPEELNTSLSDLETRVAALEKAAGISANESPSSIEPGPEESGDDDGMTVAPDPEVLNDDE